MSDGMETSKSSQSRKWVREYKAAMENMAATVWFSDLETRKISWEGKGGYKKPRRHYYKPKQKVEKDRMARVDQEGIHYAMQGQD